MIQMGEGVLSSAPEAAAEHNYKQNKQDMDYGLNSSKIKA